MGMGYAIHQLLTNGQTGGQVTGIRVGDLKQQELYPVVQVNDFSIVDNCKDDHFREVYTVTVIPWAAKQWKSEEIAKAIRDDLARINPGTYNGLSIQHSMFVSRGPWLRDETKKYWGRPLDFDFAVNI